MGFYEVRNYTLTVKQIGYWVLQTVKLKGLANKKCKKEITWFF